MFNFPHDRAHKTQATRQAATPTVLSPRSRIAHPILLSSTAQANLISSPRSIVLDILAARQSPNDQTEPSLDVISRLLSERRVTPSIEPTWMTQEAPVKQGEAFWALFQPRRKALQGALAKVHSELQSAASSALAKDFRTAIFTPDATREEKKLRALEIIGQPASVLTARRCFSMCMPGLAK